MKLYFLIINLTISTFGSSVFSQIYGSCNVKQMDFYSQASQDVFVFNVLYGILNKSDNGYYLEIGAGNPQDINNTYFFERNLGWHGVSIDLLDSDWYSVRKNPLLVQDATQSDYVSILKSFPIVIDYLSLDIDGDYDTVLQRIPFNDHIFKIITIEHDFYRYGELFRESERQILISLGYHLLCPNVSCGGCCFEDWWIHPSVFPPAVFSALASLDLKEKDHKELVKTIASYCQLME